MTELNTRCQCRQLGPDFPCTAQMNAEDLLCDACRAARRNLTGHGAAQRGAHYTVRDRPGFPR